MADFEIKKENIISTGNMTLFLCNFCNECYSQERSFKLHCRAHKKFTCDFCGKVFSLKRELTVHHRAHEKLNKLFVCDVCKKVCNSKVKLKSHKRTHENEKLHACDVCKNTFSSKMMLKQHYSTHKEEKLFVCDICKETFREKSSLQKHASTHTAENPSISKTAVIYSKKLKNRQINQKSKEQHACDICQKTFSSKAALKRHSRSHEGEKSCTSDIAERAFNELSSSNTFYHAREKPHVCIVCKKAFSRKSSLMSHNCARKKES